MLETLSSHGCDYNLRATQCLQGCLIWSEEVNEPEEVQPEGSVRGTFPSNQNFVDRKIIVTQNFITQSVEDASTLGQRSPKTGIYLTCYIYSGLTPLDS